MTDLEFTDRYSALRMPAPDLATMCKGQCEGTGWIPVKAAETDPELQARWRKAEEANHAADGWHFVECPDCQGSGLRKARSPGRS